MRSIASGKGEPRLWPRAEAAAGKRRASVLGTIAAALAEEAKREGLEQRRPEDFENPEMERIITALRQRTMFIDDVMEEVDRGSRLAEDLAAEIRTLLQARRTTAETELEIQERSYEEWQQRALIAYYQTGEEADPDDTVTVNRPDPSGGWLDWLF